MQLARFQPRIFQALHGYDLARLVRDVGAGFTVGVVALPLAMAFAIASGLKPEAGLWTAIIGGALVSLLGGTRAQIAGPAGAFIVIVYGIVDRYGPANLLIATACAGVLLFGLGLLKLGNLVRFVPVSIIIGFTNGIALLIAVSQFKDFLGLPIAKMPASFFAQLQTIGQHLSQVNFHAVAIGLITVLGLEFWTRLWNPRSRVHLQILEMPSFRAGQRIPGPVVALVSMTILVAWLNLPVETIGQRFGQIPATVPAWVWPEFSWDSVRHLLTPTMTIALLGAIESLLCARVADQVAKSSGADKHDPNQELMAQGVANMVVPFFGGMPVTGTIARTVTNIRSGASSPISGVIHALVVMGVVLLAASSAERIPLAVLAGILLYVAWNMGEWREFARARQFSNHYRLLMIGTFALTVIFDLTVAIEVGIGLACVLFVKRMGSLCRIERIGQHPGPDGQTVMTYALHGALFFGAVDKLDPLLAVVEGTEGAVHLRLDATDLMQLDTSGLDALLQLMDLVKSRGGRVELLGLQAQPASLLERDGRWAGKVA
jgi:sulfate permease, SulP family